jgi:23S rRNA pseudouridine1911/1915/1917 synthase
MSFRTDSIVFYKSHPNERLDHVLRLFFPAVSRTTLQRLIEEGHIRVNGEATKVTHSPREGERVDVKWPEPKAAEAQPENIPLQILYEDTDLLVVNKPPGLVVHPAVGHDEHTLVNALLHHCAGNLSGIGGVARPGIVHRLDQDTSGCIVVAKNDAAHVALAGQFESRTVEKVYRALLCGELPKQTGEIRASIARHPTHRKRMAATDGTGRAAWTSYIVESRLKGATLVQAMLHTGRTHQIRVHFQYLGYPLVGDRVYGVNQNKRLIAETNYSAPRQMLHAQKLTFTHPRTNERVSFEAPLPDDFQQALSILKRD